MKDTTRGFAAQTRLPPHHAVGAPNMRLLTALVALLLMPTMAAADPLAWTGPVPEELQAESHYVEVNGNRWHYVASGEGPPLVLLHGFPAQSYLWRGVIPELAKTHRVIVPDLLGHGRSAKDASIDLTPQSHAAHLEAFMASMAFDEPVVLGVTDLGSALGLHWASEHEPQVRGLVLVEAIIYPGEAFYKAAPLQMKLMFSTLHDNPKLARKMLVDKNMAMKKLQSMSRRELSEAEVAEYEQAWSDPEVRETVLMAIGPHNMPKKGRTTSPSQSTALMDQFGPWLATTSVPKLVLTVKPGLLIQRDDIKYIESTFTNTTIVPIGRGKHFAPEDQPDAIAEATATWLATLKPGDPTAIRPPSAGD